jgi:hypothetical protein
MRLMSGVGELHVAFVCHAVLVVFDHARIWINL